MGFVTYSSAPASSPVTTSSESVFAVTRMIGMNGREASAFRRRHTSTPSSLGIITSSNIRSGRCRLAAVRRLEQLVAMHLQSSREDVTVGSVVVGDQNARRVVHAGGSSVGRYSRIFAR